MAGIIERGYAPQQKENKAFKKVLAMGKKVKVAEIVGGAVAVGAGLTVAPVILPAALKFTAFEGLQIAGIKGGEKLWQKRKEQKTSQKLARNADVFVAPSV